MSISFSARQKFRQRIQSIEKADEILDALDEFVNRFQLLNGTFSSTNWEDIFTYIPTEGSGVLLTFSVIAKEQGNNKYGGFKRTAIFYKQNGNVFNVNLTQTDFTATQENGFNARFLVDGGNIKLQVKGYSNNLTSWQGSLEIEQHLGE
jgi:hypothetical protein